jgi:predicted nucleic acid-binding protein
MVNLDTNTALAFVAEGSPIRYQLREYVKGQQMVITQTAFEEFTRIVQGSGGVLEQRRASRFLQLVTLIPDNPSPRALSLQPTRRLEPNDIIILGTGDQLGIVTMTADVNAIKSALAQGVDFNVYVHPSCSLKGV